MDRSSRQPASRRQRRRSAALSRKTSKSSPPAPLPASLEQARRAAQQGRHDQALSLYGQAAAQSKDHPQHIALLAEAAKACAARLETRRAEALLDRLVAQSTNEGVDTVSALLQAAAGYALAYRPDRAMDCYRKVLEIAPARPAAAVELAALHERRGELDKALTVLKPIPAGVAEADNVRARIARRRGEADKAAAILRPICESSTLHPMIKARAGYELARLLDEKGDYDAAWQALLSAKAQQRSTLRPGHAEHARRQMDQHHALIDSLTPEQLKRWAEQSKTTVDATQHSAALLTGLPRSGTTLLLSMLKAHPRIIGADERHVLARVALPGLFDADATPDDPLAAFDAIPNQRLARQRDQYFDLMSQSLDRPLTDKLLLDKNPAMLRLLPGVCRLLPDAPRLIALRDPRDVLVSMLFTWMPMNDVSVQLLEPGSAADFCADELGLWLKLRGMIDRWHEVRYESLVEQPETVLRQVIDHLGLAWDKAVLDRFANPTQQVDSPTYEQVAKPVYTSAIGRWRHYQPMMEACFATLEGVAGELGYD